MSQLTDNLSAIASIKSDIRAAIESKGVSMSGVSFGSYAEKIGEIQAGGGYTEKDITEGVEIVNLSNSATYVTSGAFGYRDSLKTVYLPDCSVIYDNAFVNCSNLESVYIPNIEYIYLQGFYRCYKLLSITLSNCSQLYDQAFYGCSMLTDIYMPKCSSIGNYAFNGCTGLNKVDLPVCSYLGGYAFAQCSRSLSMLVLRSTSVCSISGNVFWGTDNCNVYVPNSLLESYKTANQWSSISGRIYPMEEDFEFSNGLVSGWAVSMDSGYLNTLGIVANDVTGVSMSFLKYISSSTFMNHQNIISVSMPIVKEYPDDLFNGCTALSDINIEVSVLGDRVFANCTGLERVYLNYIGIVTPGSNMFSNCTSLSQIYVPDEMYSDYLTTTGWSIYSSLMYPLMPILSFSNGLVYGRTSNIDSTFLRSLNITSNQVVSVSLPNCLSVGSNTFLEFHSLKDIYLPECEYIDGSAFFGANYINGLDLPKCSYIGDYAFYWCAYSMSYLKLGYSGVCTLAGLNALNNTGALSSILVPSSLVEAYKSARNWSNYSNKIYPIPE